MVTFERKESTQEELDAHRRASEEANRKSERVEIKLVTKPAVTMLEGQLTTDMLTELNNYIDENDIKICAKKKRDKLKIWSNLIEKENA